MYVVINYWLGTILPISTVVSEDALAVSTSDPSVQPPMTIILLSLSKATPTLCLGLVSEPAFHHEFLVSL